MDTTGASVEAQLAGLRAALQAGLAAVDAGRPARAIAWPGTPGRVRLVWSPARGLQLRRAGSQETTRHAAPPAMALPLVDSWYVLSVGQPGWPTRPLALGWAADVASRLRAHQAMTPMARLLGTWRGPEAWAPAALAYATAEACVTVVPGVGDTIVACADVGLVLDRAAAFFRLMPPVGALGGLGRRRRGRRRDAAGPDRD
jgi:hypothetical protein